VAKIDNNTASIGFEQQIWGAADILRGNIGNLSVYGQDANPTTRKMALMNLAIRGIEADLGGYNADTFHNDLHQTLKADFILANPPFNLSDWNDGALADVKGFCAVVKTEEIAKQDYILTPGRYVGIEEQEDDGEPFEEKMTRLTGELSEMFKRSRELEEEIRKRLGAIGYEV